MKHQPVTSNRFFHRGLCVLSGKSLLLFGFIFLFVSGFLLAAGKPRMEDIAGKLACYCGTCPHLTVTKCGCSTADQIKSEIQQMIDQGQSADQIMQGYIAKYGQTVLAAPTKSGFNLTAWAIPFLAFLFGGAMLFSYLKKQRSLAKVSPEETSKSFDDHESYYRDMVKKELELRK